MHPKPLEAAYPRWITRKGSKSSIARIVSLAAIPNDVRTSLEDWARKDLDEASDFYLAASLGLHEDELERSSVRSAFRTFVDAERSYILSEYESAEEARAAFDEVQAVAKRLEIPLHWNESELEERIAELEGPEPDGDFDYEEAREAHRERQHDERIEQEAIADLFSTLVDSEEGAG